MIPLPDKPDIILYIDPNGNVHYSTNVSPNIEVTVVDNKQLFDSIKQGMPFEGQQS
jgi:hypothetical protein